VSDELLLVDESSSLESENYLLTISTVVSNAKQVNKNGSKFTMFYVYNSYELPKSSLELDCSISETTAAIP
jgi:hypothetical protein